ncbi:MAG: DUF1232 domain-containing protein [Anaerolineae bacterium]|nr:DUF1232 domain-containing protein [Anaerolineae bacterium]
MSQQKPRRSLIQHLTVIVVGIVALIYLINPAGPIDLIPDAFPVIGNLDDATAALLLLNALRFYGVDLSNLFGATRTEDTVIEGEFTHVDENNAGKR